METWINCLKPALSILAFSMICFCVYGQKLPSKQSLSLRTPDNAKIDGRSSEWKNKFQAYNNSTEIFYRIANDDKQLYLIIKAVKPVIVRKIISQGITFTLNNSEKKAGNNISITYPLLHNNTGTILLNLKAKPLPDDAAAARKQIDSSVTTMNKQLIEKSKEIKITDSPTMPDSTISIYNETGIKAMALFDNDKAYTYELGIPLKLISLTTDKPDHFKYNIKLNGLAINGINVQLTADGTATIRSSPGYTSVVLKNTPESLTLDYPTDFSGEYTLAKK